VVDFERQYTLPNRGIQEVPTRRPEGVASH
jgi:hypothetical protein